MLPQISCRGSFWCRPYQRWKSSKVHMPEVLMACWWDPSFWCELFWEMWWDSFVYCGRWNALNFSVESQLQAPPQLPSLKKVMTMNVLESKIRKLHEIGCFRCFCSKLKGWGTSQSRNFLLTRFRNCRLTVLRWEWWEDVLGCRFSWVSQQLRLLGNPF